MDDRSVGRNDGELQTMAAGIEINTIELKPRLKIATMVFFALLCFASNFSNSAQSPKEK